jgi:MFS family permease
MDPEREQPAMPAAAAPPRAGLRRTFAALALPNFRRYFAGQSVSLTGTWMQRIAQSWLVLELSHSGTVLGLVVAAQTLPVLALGPYGGLIADRMDKRTLLLFTQATMGVLALVLGLLTLTHAVRLWMVFLLAAGLGSVTAADSPTRQTFVHEMAGPERLANAVTLNTIMVNASRAIGPAVAGVLIATAGTGVCFLVNAASFAAVLVALGLIRTAELHRAALVTREPGQLRAGLRYVRTTPALLVPLLMMALVGTLAYEFQVVLPLLARVSLGGGAETYGFLSAAMGAGAVAGGLVVATLAVSGLSRLTLATAAFGAAILAAAVVPSFPAEMAAMALTGAGSTAFISVGAATLQLTSDPQFRGRVMALWSVTFLGSTPIGGPLVGLVAQYLSPRYALGLGALACLAAAGTGLAGLRRLPPGERRAAQQRSAQDGIPGPGAGQQPPAGLNGLDGPQEPLP